MTGRAKKIPDEGDGGTDNKNGSDRGGEEREGGGQERYWVVEGERGAVKLRGKGEFRGGRDREDA